MLRAALATLRKGDVASAAIGKFPHRTQYGRSSAHFG